MLAEGKSADKRVKRSKNIVLNCRDMYFYEDKFRKIFIYFRKIKRHKKIIWHRKHELKNMFFFWEHKWHNQNATANVPKYCSPKATVAFWKFYGGD